jgi:hypothetical protein
MRLTIRSSVRNRVRRCHESLRWHRRDGSDCDRDHPLWRVDWLGDGSLAHTSTRRRLALLRWLHREPWGLVVLLAMPMGLPLLVSQFAKTVPRHWAK